MSKKISLSETLSSLINTKPVLSDSEDDDLTKPDQLTKNDDGSDFSADELDLKKFRKLNIEFLDADDNKYSGKKSSRNEATKAFGSDSSEVEDSSGDELDDGEVNDADSPVDTSEDEDVEEEEGENEYREEEEDNEDSEEDDEDYEDDGNDENYDIAPADSSYDDRFNKDIILKASSDIDKGIAIKNQLHIWDFLLESRMKFQKCLTSANQLPISDNLKKFQQNGGDEFQKTLSDSQKSLQHLLNSFMQLQEVLLQRNDEFKHTSKHKLSADGEDEEITSDSDMENDEKKKAVDDEPKIKSKKKKRKLTDFSSEIDDRHKQMEDFRNKTIQKWNDKTRLGHVNNKDFHGFEQSTLKQIEHVLQDKERLIKRTQVKRSNYHILGQVNEDSPPNKILKTDDNIPVDVPSNKENDRKICKEIFDDDDFYIQLLNELVKRKGSDITDPLQLGKQWVQLQKHRSKVKKDIDRRASKGRKIRYVVHPKLVNFMMPIPKTSCSEEARTELINSLFGKNKKSS